MSYPSQFLRKAFHPGFIGPAPTIRPGLISADSFNRANGSLGSTDGQGSADPLTWTTDTGTWVIDTNRAAASALTAGIAIAHEDTGAANVDIAVTFAVLGAGLNDAGLLFRFTNTSNYWILVQNVTDNYLFKNVAGFSSGVFGPIAGASAGDVMRVVANGNVIQCYRNGSLLGGTTDSFNATATKHGFYSSSTAARYDDWSVYPA